MSEERQIPLVGDVFQQCLHLAECASKCPDGSQLNRGGHYLWKHPRELLPGYASFAALCASCHTDALLGKPVAMDQAIMVLTSPITLDTVEQRN